METGSTVLGKGVVKYERSRSTKPQGIEKKAIPDKDSLFEILRFQTRRQSTQVINGTLGMRSCRKDSAIVFFEDRKP